MITFNSDDVGKIGANPLRRFFFQGLSTDEKPVGTHDGAVIHNGSMFQEIDTGDIYVYDQENETWYSM